MEPGPLRPHHKRLRRYAPLLMEPFDFSASPPSEPQLGAVEILKAMNAAKRRKVPDDTPTGFAKPRWEPHVFAEDGSIDRASFEACVLSELKDGLRCGDIPVAVNPDLDAYLAERDELLHRELGSPGSCRRGNCPA